MLGTRLLNQAHCKTNLWFQRIAIPTQNRGHSKEEAGLEGGEGLCSKKATFLKEGMNQNWSFQSDGRFEPKIPLQEAGV